MNNCKFSIELHIFTNSTISAPSTSVIQQTYNSVSSVFGDFYKTVVWCDPNPNLENSAEYILNLKKCFNDVRETKSLSDGYIKSINESSADFLFMLEHDWTFVNDRIHHTLLDICNVMIKDDLIHFRFNKRKNTEQGLDKTLIEVNGDITYCVTPFLSNNPHIIRKDSYKEKALKYLRVDTGTYGIEHQLMKVKKLQGAIYGELDSLQTVCHLDGRHSI